MVGEVLSKSFAVAHRNLAVIFFDLFWKAVWLAVTLTTFMLIGWWFAGALANMPWPDVPLPGTMAWQAVTVLRQFWDENGASMIGAVLIAVVSSVALWLVSEAFFRSRIFPSSERALIERPYSSEPQAVGAVYDRPRFVVQRGFLSFLLTRVLKLGIFTGTAVILGLVFAQPFLHAPIGDWPTIWEDSSGVIVVSVIVLSTLGFLLSVIETLVRGDALGLLGTHLIPVAAVIGTLTVFELMIGTSLTIAVLLGVLYTARLIEIGIMFGVGTLAVVFMTCLHSYLLLVRFSAVEHLREATSD